MSELNFYMTIIAGDAIAEYQVQIFYSVLEEITIRRLVPGPAEGDGKDLQMITEIIY